MGPAWRLVAARLRIRYDQPPDSDSRPAAQLRMRLAAPRDRTPVLPGAEARWNEQEGGRWEIESRVPLNRAALILAPYSAAERDFNGLRVKFLVFPIIGPGGIPARPL
jgi:hypothetical protein